MQHITDSMVDDLVSAHDAQRVLADAFLAFGQGQAAMQARIRTDAGGVKLSTLGAVIPTQEVVGAKVYTTIQGQFNFVILLFSAADGRPLATFDAGALTRLRTAACSVLIAQKLAKSDARVLGLFGAGTQGVEHAVQMAQAFSLARILVQDPYATAETLDRIAQRTGLVVQAAEGDDIADQADIVVTASRSLTPLFSGASLRPGAFIAAIGSSLPHTRELDDVALARAKAVVVEWKPQSMAEAGDLVLADPALNVAGKTFEFAQVLANDCSRSGADDIFIYKSVGVGLEDIALAGYAYKQLQAC